MIDLTAKAAITRLISKLTSGFFVGGPLAVVITTLYLPGGGAMVAYRSHWSPMVSQTFTERSSTTP